MIASGHRVALDVEAVKVIKSYKGTSLTEDTWSYTQIRRVAELGVGVRSEQEHRMIREG